MPHPQPQEPFTLTGVQGMDRATIDAAPTLAHVSEFLNSDEMGDSEAEQAFADMCNEQKMPCPPCKAQGLVHAYGIMKPPRTSRTVRYRHSISQLRVLTSTCPAFPSVQLLCCGILFHCADMPSRRQSEAHMLPNLHRTPFAAAPALLVICRSTLVAANDAANFYDTVSCAIRDSGPGPRYFKARQTGGVSA